MLPLIEQLIERYKDHPKCILRGVLMPINSNTKYNGYLKEIAEICGIKRNLTTHLARHTFADIMLNLGMPLEDLGKMLGHRSIRTTQRYCRVSIRRLQKNFNQFIRPNIKNVIPEYEKVNSPNTEVLKSAIKSIHFQAYNSTSLLNYKYINCQ